MNNKKSYKIWQVVLLLVFLYFVVAMTDQFKGMLVPNFKSYFNVNNVQIGHIMTASLFSYAVFQYVGGSIIEKFNSYKKAILLGFIIELISIVLLLSTNSYISLIIGLFGISAGMAMFNVTLNALCLALPVKSTAVLLNFLGFTYGASATTIQKVGGNILFGGATWQSFFMFMFIASTAVFVFAGILKMPSVERENTDAKGKNLSIITLLKNKTILLYVGALGFYLASEYNVGGWFVNYMVDSFEMNQADASIYTALFFGTLTIARLGGGFLADKIGYLRSVIIFSIISSSMSVIGVLAGKGGLLILACSGLFYSLICPVITSTVSKAFDKNISQITGFLFMSGTLVAMLVNMLIGVLSDNIGTQYAFLTIGVCLALTGLFSLLISRKVDLKK
ncbi:MAG: MFS transporter [Vallitalea sp.]|jgi:fucose permease|nr:MFS transporter [Vallitalea sp.]